MVANARLPGHTDEREDFRYFTHYSRHLVVLTSKDLHSIIACLCLSTTWTSSGDFVVKRGSFGHVDQNRDKGISGRSVAQFSNVDRYLESVDLLWRIARAVLRVTCINQGRRCCNRFSCRLLETAGLL